MTRKRKWTHLLFALALLAIFVSAGTLLAGKGGKKPPKDDPPPPDISYSITLLGTLGGSRSDAFDINQLGDMVGSSMMADGTSEAFVYFSNTETMHRLRDLVTAADQVDWGWTSTRASGINSWGQICLQELGLTSGAGTHAVRISLVFDEVGVVIPGKPP